MANLTYTIEPGQYGEVMIWCEGVSRPIARRIKATIVRSDRQAMEGMLKWMAGSSWSWLGIDVRSLPHGITLADILTAYMIARDEIIEAGFCLPETPTVPVA